MSWRNIIPLAPEFKEFKELTNQKREKVPEVLKVLTAAEHEEWEERAAIMEYDGGMPRNIAEREAYNNVIDIRRYKNGN